MPDASKLSAIDAIGREGYVSAKDVLALRRTVFSDGVLTRPEIDALFSLAARAPEGDPEWAAFFCEAAADYFLREEEPHGYLTEEEFDSLKARIAHGAPANRLMLSLLVRLTELATSTPDAMSEFIAAQIKVEIAARKAGPRVSGADVALIRRFLFAAGGGANVRVSRREAAFLFDISDLTAGSANDPAWTDLFVRAIANHLMASLGYAPPSREEAMRRHAAIADHSINVGGFFRRMISGSLSSLRGRVREDAAVAGEFDEQITPEEADWLADRIGKDGQTRAEERALIAHLRTFEAPLPPRLRDLVGPAA